MQEQSNTNALGVRVSVFWGGEANGWRRQKETLGNACFSFSQPLQDHLRYDQR